MGYAGADGGDSEAAGGAGRGGVRGAEGGLGGYEGGGSWEYRGEELWLSVCVRDWTIVEIDEA